MSDSVEEGDVSLVERVLAGDRSAADALVKEHQPGILRLVRRYVRRPEDAEDVTQRAFLNAFEKLADFRRESSFRTWLYRIAVHVALNHVRGSSREGPLADMDDLPAFTNSLETSRLVAAEVWGRVAQRLEELPPKQRLTVELRLFHELSFREIAVLADCSEDSAKVNFHHGIKRLRGLIPDPNG
ncbi:RNA polymerase sigma factor [Polyangium sp. y55x31]|uniref:RNA polymerase sigma factor n=1 Tax=Polyangium sp. y55x31 TaxID=3042688 RepID=UPI00248310FB|nr:RNA polymerase sigma factor [Polyangium sp. y55x31]MDI1483361.1 RNA polymerase sigma factor [Polyangium sp. y55x31]